MTILRVRVMWITIWYLTMNYLPWNALPFSQNFRLEVPETFRVKSKAFFHAATMAQKTTK